MLFLIFLLVDGRSGILSWIRTNKLRIWIQEAQKNMYLDPEDWTKKYFVISEKIVQNLSKSSATQGRFRKALPCHCDTFGPKTIFCCHSTHTTILFFNHVNQRDEAKVFLLIFSKIPIASFLNAVIYTFYTFRPKQRCMTKMSNF